MKRQRYRQTDRLMNIQDFNDKSLCYHLQNATRQYNSIVKETPFFSLISIKPFYITKQSSICSSYSTRNSRMRRSPVYLNGINCKGDEPNIVACKNLGWDRYQRLGSCSLHGRDAAVQCFREGES